MFSRKQPNVGFLVWAVAGVVTLGVAVGASAVVPQLISSEGPEVVVSAQVDVPTEAPAEVAAPAAAPEAEVAIVEEIIVPEVKTVVTSAPKKASAPQAVVQAPAAVEAPAPVIVPPPPPAPVLAPRTVPSAAQRQSVISTIKGQVPLLALVSISPAQVDDIGNQVCTAFDQGKTFAEVKALGLAQVPAIVTIPAATADYAVRQAVALYCPAYASKLV